MDVREKLVELVDTARRYAANKCHSFMSCAECDHCGEYDGKCRNTYIAESLIAHGVTVQEWISVKERTPTEADGTVWVCLADVFPYNDKEPYPDAKHDGRITEAHYSEFSKRWYRGGGIFPNGVVTHWMEKPQPPKGE